MAMWPSRRNEDVARERVDHLIEHRIPWLVLGILGGFLATLVVSKYEAILSADIRLAFFIPMIVYMSDAVGTQTETIYVRALSGKKKIVLLRYFLKESFVGLGLGTLSGLVFGAFAYLWLGSLPVALTVGLTMLINVTFAPMLGVCIPALFKKEHRDPALGAGPVATIIQDFLSLLVYFVIASFLIF